MSQKTKSKKFIVIFLIILFLISGTFLFWYRSGMTTVSAAGEGWLRHWMTGWTYRKVFSVSNSSGGVLTDYQLRITVPYATGMQADFDDLRFTQMDGFTNLPYWIESKTDSSSAVVWVKIPYLSTGTSYLVMYYGNSSATSLSNGTATFDFFDDFTGSSIDATKWSITDATGWSVASGELKGASTTGRIKSIATFSSGTVLEVKSRVVSFPSGGYMIGGFWLSTSDSIGVLHAPTATYYRNNDAWTQFSTTLPSATNILTKFSVKSSSAVDLSVTNYSTGASYQSVADISNTVTTEPIVLGKRYNDLYPDQTYEAYWDWIFVHKYASAVPTYNFWGAQTETVNTSEFWGYRKAITITNSSGGALTNYQVAITVPYAFGMQADFDDLRFTSSDGSTVLNYWIESKTNSSTAKVWVKIPSLATGSNLIYMYYGDSWALAGSNGDNTFDFFDDFSGISLNTSKWNLITSDIAYTYTSTCVSGGGLTCTETTANGGLDVVYKYTLSGTETGTTNFTVPAGVSSVSVLVVAGGGGGGRGGEGSGWGGGGGAGGLIYTASQAVSGSVSVTVGVGGPKGASRDYRGTSGGNSSFGSTTAVGGGGGGSGWYNNSALWPGLPGGSGGGGQYYGGAGGAGTAGQGNNGAAGLVSPTYGGGGGGAGGAASGYTGGVGLSSSITDTAVTYAAGGAGYGGSTNAPANTGNGGPSGTKDGLGGNGGSGIVIVRFTKPTGGGGEPITFMNGELRIKNTVDRLKSIATFSSGTVLEIKSRAITLPGNGYMTGGFWLSTSNGVGLLNHPGADFYRSNSTWTQIATSSPLSTNLLTKISVKSSSAVDISVTNYDTGASYQSVADISNTVTTEPIVLGKRYDDGYAGQSYEAYWDWIFLHKYASSEPTAIVETVVETPMGVCGSSNSMYFTSAPTTNLCNFGTASAVSSVSGQWTWTCTGATGSTPTTCSTSNSIGKYRKMLTITNSSGGVLTNYQVPMTVTYDSDMQDDFDDLRFTSSDGLTLLDYWIESKTDSSTAKVWVEVPSLAVGANVVYMYYSNSGATAGSNGAATFDFFDDFSGHEIDTAKWTLTSTPSIIDGIAYINNGQGITEKTAIAPPIVFDVKYQRPSYYRNRINTIPFPTGIADFGDYPPSVYWNGSTGTVLSNNTWYLINHVYSPTIFYWNIDTYGGSQVFTRNAAYTGTTTYLYYRATESVDSQLRLDWAFAHKYASAIPTTVFGAEQLTIASCGTANGTYVSSAPTTNLCAAGTAGSVTGSGPWYWNCNAGNGTLLTRCIAYVADQTSLKGWSNKRVVTVSNDSGTNLTNYAIRLTVPYISGMMKTDFSDLRFTNYNSSAQFSYWIESYVSATSAIVWVKIPSIPSTGTTFYMYHGNSSAYSAANGDNTFIFFDDFSEPIINTTKWAVTDTSKYITQNGTLNVSDGAGWGVTEMHTNSTFNRSDGIVIQNKYKSTMVRGRQYGDTTMLNVKDSGTGTNYTDFIYAVYVSESHSSIAFSAYEDGASKGSAGSLSPDTQYDFRQIIKTGGGVTVQLSTDEGENWATKYDSTSSTEATMKAGFVHYQGGDVIIDDMIVRKYVSPEPTATISSSLSIRNPNCPAVGGVITESGGYCIHTFTANETFIPDYDMDVEVFAWGGGGAGGTPGGWGYGAAGGAGGAAKGTVSTIGNSTYMVAIGGGGQINSLIGAVGGGAPGSCNGSGNIYGGGGGGYSGVFSNSISQANAIIIAGGGGGGGSSRAGTGNAGGGGGGGTGQTGYSPYDGKTAYGGNPGTQSAAGADASSDSANCTGGQGALQGGTTRTNSYGGGGGGGYWGGSGGGYSEGNTMGGGGGGSGYINPTLVTSGVLTAGSGTTPGDSGNAYRGTAGNAGAASGNGNPGIVVIRYIPVPVLTQSAYGQYMVNKYTGIGNVTWTVPTDVTSIDVLVVAGGGGGGGDGGGGGGGGGLIYQEGYSVTPGQVISLTVGAGGAGSLSNTDSGTSGKNSIFGTITATGGGRGASGQAGLSNALVGGSGGGGDGERPTAGASGTALQGNSGGSGLIAGGGAGGGGGAGAVGLNSSTAYGAAGGAGLVNSITGASIYYAGGGGGGNNNTIVGDAAGGIGGGGDGGLGIGESGENGTGGGGGGGTWDLLTGTGGNGGSGTVILRYSTGMGLGFTENNPGTDCNQIYIYNSLARTNGVYWVRPDTSSPAFRVYCDMVTDGGGWTLIGKGREGWNWNNAGQGTADDVALNPDTNTVSFLPSTTVDALVGGADISSMTGAVRVYRHGVDQDWRFNYPTMTTWDWLMTTSKTAVVASRTPACTGTTSGNTNDTYWCDGVNGCNRIFTWGWANHNYVTGWSAGSYCNCTAYGEDGWCYTTEGHVILRTQVWIKNLNPKPALPTWREISPF